MKEITEIILGSKVRDLITGFEGIVTARIKYLNGCIQYCVEPEVDKDGKMQKHHYIDCTQLIKIHESSKEETKEKGPGGKMPNVPE